MPCPHFDVKIIQRSKRQSAVASAAYQSGERLFSEYDQKQKYYSHKSEIVHTEIILPPHAPPEYADRNTLWNAAEAIEKQYTRTHTSSGMSANYGKFVRQGTGSSDGRRYPGNVLFVPTVMGGIHPTQKPVELCEYFIKTYTDEGAVVADICAGSGTTAVAALNTGRRFICFENAPAIYGPATQRIEQARLAVERGGKGV